MPSPGCAQESRTRRERPRGKAGGCELPGSPATPQSTKEKENKGSGEFTRAKDKLASALPPRCAALLQIGALDGGTLPAGPRAVIAAIIFFSQVFSHLLPPVALTVKRLSAMQETRVRSLGWEDPLEKEMATHSSILAWKIPWMEEPSWLLAMGSQRVRHD